MWKEFSLDQPWRNCFLALAEPKYVRTLNAGQNFFTSVSQLTMQLVGATIKCGPQIPLAEASDANIPIVWTVFPNPISSAKMPFRPFASIEHSH